MVARAIEGEDRRPPPGRASTLHALARAVRPHQWAKNVLVFVPAVAGHRLDAATLGDAGRAFVCMSCCASAAYVLNDLVDAEADRLHPTKRSRPFAARAIPPWVAYALPPALLMGAAAVAWPLPASFVAILGAYVVATFAYSLRLKRVAVLDVLVLAALYVIRVIAGSAATEIAVSDWLLSFAMFLFLSLALVKRTSELRRIGAPAGNGRGYELADESQLAALGTASGCVAVMVLALYLQSPAVTLLYRSPRVLWGLCPLLLYWTSRIWLLARRGLVDDDPVVFALSDPASYAVAAAAGALLYLAS